MVAFRLLCSGKKSFTNALINTLFQTMTFYEGGESSNGETQATIDVPADNAASPSEKEINSSLQHLTDSTPAAVDATPVTPSEQ